MVQIAVDYNVGIDIHLLEGGKSGIKAISRMADFTEEAGLEGKVTTINHAFSLASLSEESGIEFANRLASLGFQLPHLFQLVKL